MVIKKAMIFVEGDTELAFLEHFLTQIANQQQLSLNTTKLKGSLPAIWRRSDYTPIGSDSITHELFIMNCACDDNVLSAIRDRYDDLVNAGHSMIVGLRDLHPKRLSDLNELKKSNKELLPVGPVVSHIVIAVHELESWFIGEHTHFQRYNPSLDYERINDICGLDIRDGDVENMIFNPTTKLKKAYKLCGGSYRKGEYKANKTIQNLDLEFLYIDARERLPSLGEFLDLIDKFFENH